MAAIGTVTVGDQIRQIVVAVTDENGNVVPLSATVGDHLLQGRSPDLPAKTINVAANSVDTAQGRITWLIVGALVTQAELTAASNIASATFRLKAKYKNNVAAIGFTDEFFYIWTEDPLQPA